MKAAIIFAVFFSFSSTTFAESLALDIEHFEPVGAPQNNILNLHQSKVLSDEEISLSALFHFSTQTLSVDFDRGEDRVWIENQLSANVAANLGLFDFLELGISLPLILNRTYNPSIQNLNKSKHTYLSDTRLVGKIQLPLNAFLGNIGIAMVGSVYLPTGNRNNLSGLGTPRFEPRLVVDFRTEEGSIFTANIARQTYQERRVGTLVDDGNITLSMGGKFRIVDSLALLSTYSARFHDSATGSEADVALRFNYKGWSLLAGGGVGITNAPGIPAFRAMTGFSYATDSRKKDIDGDGVSVDKCPLQAEDFDGYQDHDGCPEDDNDADGLADDIDKCANAAEDLDGFEDEDGCPDLDNDNDGIVDTNDDCPAEKGVLKNGGCPLESKLPIPESSSLDDKDPQ